MCGSVVPSGLATATSYSGANLNTSSGPTRSSMSTGCGPVITILLIFAPSIYQSASEAPCPILIHLCRSVEVLLEISVALVIYTQPRSGSQRLLTFHEPRSVPITGASDAKYVSRDGSNFARRFLLS